MTGDTHVPSAVLHTRRPLQLIWLIPIIALAIAGYLGWRAVNQRGPEIVITFLTADGLTAGQTKVRHKAVELGTVERITLSPDRSHVEVRVRMRRDAADALTENARFWVVRPRLGVGNISGLETLVSGAYIELDPGAPSEKTQLGFTGLEVPPAVRSDEPGQTYRLRAARIGALSSGSPIFFRDILVGEVLGYELTGNGVMIDMFIRAPFDVQIHSGTHFWNASGISLDFGAQGIQLRVASLMAVLSGGVAFDTSPEALGTPASRPGAVFPLYPDEATANAAGFRRRIELISYFEGSVRGLSVGAPVELYGIQIGSVTDIHLEFDPSGASSRVAVRYEVQPERMMDPHVLATPDKDLLAVSQRLVDRGLRIELSTASYLTGQLVVSFTFNPEAEPAKARREGDRIVLPTQSGGLDSLTEGLGEIMRKINGLPLDQIGRNLNETLQGLRDVTNGPALKQSLQSLAAAMEGTNDLVHKLDAGVAPALKRVPAIAASLQDALNRSNKLLGSADSGYGDTSAFHRDLQHLLAQVSDTARSVRLLADYLDQHPEALLRGRNGGNGDR